MSRPPALAEAILAALLPASERDEVLGDLAEAHRAKRARGPLRASLWYWTQVLLVPAWFFASALGSLRLDAGEARRTVRNLARAPGFSLVAVLSLGLGIGATTAIAGAVHGLLLVTLPVERPEELTLVYHTWPENWERSQYGSSSTIDPTDGERADSNISWPAFEELEPVIGPDVDLAAYAFVRELSVVRGDQPAVAAGGMLVSGSYFRTLGLTAEVGRVLNDADDREGADPVAMLSHSFWMRTFGGDPTVLGSTLDLNGTPHEIVGVAQRGYVGLSPGGFFGTSEMIVPMAAHDRFLSLRMREGETLRTAAQMHWVRLIARVPGDVNRSELALAWTQVLGRQMVETGVIDAGDSGDMTVRLLEGSRGLDSLRTDTERSLLVLGLAVGLVLLIACANLTTLLLARGEVRANELALRRAIGASRWELARPQLVESLLLGAAGGVLGFVVALQAGPLLVEPLTGGAGAAVRYEPNLFLVGSATLAALVAAGLSGLAPAVRMMRTEPGDHLGSRGQGGVAGRFRLGRALIAVQIAISVPLVVGAGLFLETLGNLTSVDPGFDAEGLAVFRIGADLVTKDRDEQQRIYAQVLAELKQAPGVRSAAIVENVLVSGWQSNTRVTIGSERPMMDMNAVSPAFFETMGIRQLSGRPLTDADAAGSPFVVLVNETAERTLFDGGAIGRRFEVSGREVEIVGVVADTKYQALRDAVQPAFHDPWIQRPGGLFAVHYVVRTDDRASALEPTIRSIVSGIDPGLPVSAFRTQGDELEGQAAQERIFARLLTAFGLFGLLLSCIGLHGVMSFMVAQRRSEMGVRLALGAAPVSIVRLVLAQVAWLTMLGLAIGVLVALQVSPLVQSMLFGVEPNDGGTLATAAVVMALVALVAGAAPAIRAARVDPLKSLSP